MVGGNSNRRDADVSWEQCELWAARRREVLQRRNGRRRNIEEGVADAGDTLDIDVGKEPLDDEGHDTRATHPAHRTAYGS